MSPTPTPTPSRSRQQQDWQDLAEWLRAAPRWDFTRPWTDWLGYTLDAGQRWLIFLDAMRKAANTMRSREGSDESPLLSFEHELILDARTFDRPANYALARILPPDWATIDAEKPPVVVFDPRAGNGPGIGGFRQDSEVGMALREGFPTYFVLFFPEPCPHQTLEDVELAEVRFLEEIRRRHPKADFPVLYGNCQAGWAVAMLGADRPDVCGPIITSGAPLSYWAGGVGSHPMRVAGALTGGEWWVSYLSDLGGGRFDGAWLLHNFEQFNPARTLFKKYYDLFRDIDSEEERFLQFERWWTSFYHFTEEEMGWIVRNLFVGNRLEQGHLDYGEGHQIDLRKLEDPIVVFTSRGDNITPPEQSLHWILRVYGSTEELKRHGQRIIYLVHPEVGHLGIFVSAEVARREHRAIIENLERFPQLAPGLYELVIQRETGETDPKKAQFEVTFVERRVEDVCHPGEQRSFESMDRLSRGLAAAYRLFARPWIQPLVSQGLAARLGALHPARFLRTLFSEQVNPMMAAVAPLAQLARTHRRKASADNAYLVAERQWAEHLFRLIDTGKAASNTASEVAFRWLFA